MSNPVDWQPAPISRRRTLQLLASAVLILLAALLTRTTLLSRLPGLLAWLLLTLTTLLLTGISGLEKHATRGPATGDDGASGHSKGLVCTRDCLLARG